MVAQTRISLSAEGEIHVAKRNAGLNTGVTRSRKPATAAASAKAQVAIDEVAFGRAANASSPKRDKGTEESIALIAKLHAKQPLPKLRADHERAVRQAFEINGVAVAGLESTLILVRLFLAAQRTEEIQTRAKRSQREASGLANKADALSFAIDEADQLSMLRAIDLFCRQADGGNSAPIGQRLELLQGLSTVLEIFRQGTRLLATERKGLSGRDSTPSSVTDAVAVLARIWLQHGHQTKRADGKFAAPEIVESTLRGSFFVWTSMVLAPAEYAALEKARSDRGNGLKVKTRSTLATKVWTACRRELKPVAAGVSAGPVTKVVA